MDDLNDIEKFVENSNILMNFKFLFSQLGSMVSVPFTLGAVTWFYSHLGQCATGHGNESLNLTLKVNIFHEEEIEICSNDHPI
jgi:hypothetical protein